ncbi:N-acetyltransferase [Brachybacterium muris]|uniref:GNAT family N-acetyltransferase n=1 Tax=Brachybacterium muris TaxID=219301 RepID=UPI0021A8091F|nr:GNAT family N-acetyltransferase [Brachybacterium muris]MCT1431671.1 N-acetyltransferase [Brachybacterium muris]
MTDVADQPHIEQDYEDRAAPLTRDRRGVDAPDGSGEQHGQVQVRDRASASRYEAVIEGETVGILQYERLRDSIELIHTVTDPAHRGHGAASALVHAAFAQARRDGLTVNPICPFVESWVNRHPEEADIVAGDGR